MLFDGKQTNINKIKRIYRGMSDLQFQRENVHNICCV